MGTDANWGFPMGRAPAVLAEDLSDLQHKFTQASARAIGYVSHLGGLLSVLVNEVIRVCTEMGEIEDADYGWPTDYAVYRSDDVLISP